MEVFLSVPPARFESSTPTFEWLKYACKTGQYAGLLFVCSVIDISFHG